MPEKVVQPNEGVIGANQGIGAGQHGRNVARTARVRRTFFFNNLSFCATADTLRK